MKISMKILHWVPRIIAILSIGFVSLFAMDAFNEPGTFIEKTGHFLKHMIPSFILLLSLVIAWKWELAGGVIFTALGALMSVWVYTLNFRRTQSVGTSLEIVCMISLPFIIAGILFILSYSSKRKIIRSNP